MIQEYFKNQKTSYTLNKIAVIILKFEQYN